MRFTNKARVQRLEASLKLFMERCRGAKNMNADTDARNGSESVSAPGEHVAGGTAGYDAAVQVVWPYCEKVCGRNWRVCCNGWRFASKSGRNQKLGGNVWKICGRVPQLRGRVPQFRHWLPSICQGLSCQCAQLASNSLSKVTAERREEFEYYWKYTSLDLDFCEKLQKAVYRTYTLCIHTWKICPTGRPGDISLCCKTRLLIVVQLSVIFFMLSGTRCMVRLSDRKWAVNSIVRIYLEVAACATQVQSCQKGEILKNKRPM